MLGALILAGCAPTPAIFDPVGTPADRLSTLGWILCLAGSAIWLAVTGMVLWPLLRRGPEPDEPAGEPAGERTGAAPGSTRLIVYGTLASVLVLGGVFALTVLDLAAIGREAPEEELVVEVIGHRWWWEVRYPEQPALRGVVPGGGPVTTANEIHVPGGRRVRVRVRTADVIHSFWVPQMAGKIDLIPGQTNETWFRAGRTGVFLGQCAEYCGLQHANMKFQIVVRTEEAFRSWLERTAGPARVPEDEVARRGMEVVTRGACGTCHTIRGTPAAGEVGPELTHFGSRRRLGAGIYPNERGWLDAWVVDAQAMKPGVNMPSLDEFDGRTLRAIVAYLEGLE